MIDQELGKLEEALNDVEYKGVPLGSLLISQMYVLLSNDDFKFSFKAFIRIALSRAKLYWRGINLSKYRSVSRGDLEDRGIITS